MKREVRRSHRHEDLPLQLREGVRSRITLCGRRVLGIERIPAGLTRRLLRVVRGGAPFIRSRDEPIFGKYSPEAGGDGSAIEFGFATDQDQVVVVEEDIEVIFRDEEASAVAHIHAILGFPVRIAICARYDLGQTINDTFIGLGTMPDFRAVRDTDPLLNRRRSIRFIGTHGHSLQVKGNSSPADTNGAATGCVAVGNRIRTGTNVY